MWCDTCQVFEPYISDKARCINCGSPLRFASDDLLGESPKKIVRETRPAQVRMAEAVEDAIQVGKNLVAEAGTGTGKSFAVLVPAILSGERIVVSTATTLLQHQYVTQALPYLAEKLGDLGYSVRYAVSKGKRHYLCPKLFKKNRNKLPKPTTGREEQVHDRFLKWCEETETGDRQDLDEELKKINANAPWYFSKVSAEDCTGAKACRFQKECGYVKARAALQDARVIVANHAIVGIDVKLGRRLLPPHKIYIIDEAHKAEDYFRSAFSAEVSERSVTTLRQFLESRDIVPADDRYDAIFDDLEKANQALFRKIRSLPLAGDKTVIEHSVISNEVREVCDWLGDLVAPLNEEYQRVLQEDPDILDDLGIDKETVIACQDAAERENMVELLPVDPIDPGLLMLGISRIERLRQKLEELTRPVSSSVLYIEDTRREKNKYKIVHAPVLVGEILKSGMYPTLTSVIQTSATMSISGDFSFFKEEMGLEPDTKEFTAISPFDYRTRAILYLPKTLPPHPRNDPTCEDKEAGLEIYFEELTKEIVRLVKASKGCAFVLCSARSEMEELYRRTEERVKYPCRVQSADVSTGSIEAWFREENNPVLFATKSFWEGISVEGKQLRMVIIPKVPFPAPGDPILKAKEDIIKSRGKNAFMHLSFPAMVMDVQQGLGRLIRTLDDFGIAAILDTRAVPGAPHSKRYANKLINALPFLTQTNKFELVQQALEMLEKKYGPF